MLPDITWLLIEWIFVSNASYSAGQYSSLEQQQNTLAHVTVKKAQFVGSSEFCFLLIAQNCNE
jgi:hypothetical protein